MDKIPLILFSGGLDSTFLLYRTLQKGPCDVMYASGGQGKRKMERELEARRKIIDYLNKVCPYKVQQDYRREQHYSLAGIPNLRYSQPAAWLYSALAIIEYHRHSVLQIGYVYDDGGFCRWLPNITSVWEQLQLFSRDGGVVPVEYPLIDYTKLNILDRIDPELIPLIWVCETPGWHDKPETEHCGRCTPCKTARRVLREYEETHGYSIYSKLLATRVRRANKAVDSAAKDRKFIDDSTLPPFGTTRHIDNITDIQSTPFKRDTTEITSDPKL